MVPISILDLAAVKQGSDAGSALRETLAVAQQAERLGFHRVWLAEHHNMPGVASAATSVALGFIAANTERIRIGAGGVMLPNHAPLVVAEQFGTLAALYPGRVDLGLGRAPGTDMNTVRALRRSPESAQHFPHDVMELMAYFEPAQPGQAVRAVPGEGLNVPVWLLGSSLYSAQLAAHLGLPFAFASHFAPTHLKAALASYRSGFQPSERLAEPYAMVAVNVYAADTTEEAQRHFRSVQQQFLRLRTGRPGQLEPPSDTPLDEAALQASGVANALSYSAVGDVDTVARRLGEVVEETGADELIVTSMFYDLDARLHSLELLAEARDRLG